MKQTQLAGALVALALLVFVVTFTMNYIGGSRPPSGPPPIIQSRSLTFPTRVVGGPLAPLECESKVEGYADFWFVNENEESIPIGLLRKNCTCAGVQLFVPPPEQQPRARSLHANTVTRLVAPLPGLAGVSATADLHALQEATPAQEFPHRDPLTVPPGAVGWVRMTWTGNKDGKQQLQAVVWVDRNDQETNLEAYLFYHPPIRLQRDLALSRDGGRDVRLDDLPRTETITVWSSTRPSLDLKPHVESHYANPASDPISVGQPQPMTPEELRLLEQENNSSRGGDPALEGRVLCGYRIPVTLARVSADGKTPCDIGPFYRYVVIRASGIDTDAIQVRFAGRVRGPVSLAVDDESGRIELGRFPGRLGQSQSVNLKADSADIKLEFNRQRTPDFLHGQVERVSNPGNKAPWLWKLTVEVKPGVVRGQFPEKGTRYQESAVYLNVVRDGQQTQGVRIPVIGTAEGD
jgi:hypothetical protein